MAAAGLLGEVAILKSAVDPDATERIFMKGSIYTAGHALVARSVRQDLSPAFSATVVT